VRARGHSSTERREQGPVEARPRAVDHFLERCDYALGVGTSFTRSLYSAQPPAHVTRAQITKAPQDVSVSYPVAQALIGDVRLVLRQLIEALEPRVDAVRRADRSVAAEIAALKSAFLAAWMPRLTANTEPISPYRVVWELMQVADRSRTVVTHDSGNPRDQTTPFYEATTPRGYLGWGKSTQLGTGLGLAIGAKLARPDWLSVHIMGDAAFGMVGLDLESTVRLGIPTLTIVFNNGLMGGYSDYLPIASAKYQINRIGGNRYARIARDLGVFAQRVTQPGDLRAVLERAIGATEAGRAALVEVITREEADVPGYDAT